MQAVHASSRNNLTEVGQELGFWDRIAERVPELLQRLQEVRDALVSATTQPAAVAGSSA